MVKTPRITAPSASAANDKPLPVLRNPYLDGIDPLIQARRTGASSLRIDRGGTRPPLGSGRIVRPVPQPPTSVGGGGGSPTNTGGAYDSRFDTLSRLPGTVGTYARRMTAQQRASF